jgi:hypothetical protein
MIKKLALNLITLGLDFKNSYSEFRTEIGDGDRKNYQVAVRANGVWIKHLPSGVQKHYLRI